MKYSKRYIAFTFILALIFVPQVLVKESVPLYQDAQ